MGKENDTLPKRNPLDLCERFSKFFMDKVNTIQRYLDSQTVEEVFYSEFTGIELQSFDAVSEREVLGIIRSSVPKTCDLDPLNSTLLLHCADTFAPYLTNVINTSLSTGKVPDLYKLAIVNPLLKKNGLDESDLNNYRPVSNLNFFSKVLERIVLAQLLRHLKSNNLETVYQSAYKACHSTETALLKVSSDILDSTDQNEICILTLLDLSAAFDTINHNIMISRLHTTYGLSGTVMEWFKSYLADRFQAVRIGAVKSVFKPITCGVPQGSVLGPVLFTLYTRPLVDIIESYLLRYHVYADDTQIYGTCYSYNHLPQLINTITKCICDLKVWMSSNRLKLNDDKTEMIIIGDQKNDTKQTQIEINNHLITCSNKVKNLGVWFDRDMSMSFYVTDLCKNLYFQLRNIAYIRNYLTNDVTKTLITSLVLSRIDYCNALLAGVQSKTINRLQLVQNSAARLIVRSKRSEHITPILQNLHWLPIDKRINYKVCLLCFKCINGAAPSYLSNSLELYTPKRNLRSSSDNTVLFVPLRKYKRYGQRSFFYIGPKSWNALPKEIRELKDEYAFKTRLKSHLFAQTFL